MALLVDADAVYYQLNVVRLVAVDLHIVGKLTDFAVDADSQVSFLRHLLEQLAVVTLAASHKRGKHKDILVGKLGRDDVYDLGFSVFYHLLAADIGVGVGHSRVEQTDKVVDFGNSANSRARVLVGGLLLNGDDRAEAVDAVHVGTFHIADEVACVSRESLHIATLAFSIDSVESKRRLAAAAQTGEDNQLVAWQVDVYILQVVFAGTKYFKFLHFTIH